MPVTPSSSIFPAPHRLLLEAYQDIPPECFFSFRVVLHGEPRELWFVVLRPSYVALHHMPFCGIQPDSMKSKCRDSLSLEAKQCWKDIGGHFSRAKKPQAATTLKQLLKQHFEVDNDCDLLEALVAVPFQAGRPVFIGTVSIGSSNPKPPPSPTDEAPPAPSPGFPSPQSPLEPFLLSPASSPATSSAAEYLVPSFDYLGSNEVPHSPDGEIFVTNHSSPASDFASHAPQAPQAPHAPQAPQAPQSEQAPQAAQVDDSSHFVEREILYIFDAKRDPSEPDFLAF